MDLKITNEELAALRKFKDEKYEAINQLMISNCETDIALLSDAAEKIAFEISYDKETIIENIKCIKLVYKLILKEFYKSRKPLNEFYRGTNLAEVERLKNEPFVDKFFIATTNREVAETEYATSWNRPASLKIRINEDVPHIFVKDVLEGDSEEVIISPFTKVKSILLSEEKETDNGKNLMIYDMEIEKQFLEELSERERNGLYTYILENCYSINRKLSECISLENENAVNYENIRKLEQLLANHEAIMEEKEASGKYPEKERNDDIDNLERIARELDDLKVLSTDLFEIRKEHINFINMWKRNVAVYMLAECREIEKQFENMELPTPSEEVKEEIKEELKEEVVEKENDNEDSQVTAVVENVKDAVEEIE